MLHLFALSGGKFARRAFAAAGLTLSVFAADASAQWCGPVCNSPCQPYSQPCLPAPGQPSPAEAMMGSTESMSPMGDPAVTQPSFDDFAFNSGVGGGVMGNENLGGYIDNAVIANRLRMRYDNVQGGNNDFAEFLYGAYGINGNPLIQNYDYNEGATYLEYMLTCNFSVFINAPFRAAQYDDLGLGAVRNEAGIADIDAGFKYGLINDGCSFLTAQLKVFVPTGNVQEGLGTGHVSIQPGLLAQRDYDRFHVFGELHDWISLSDRVVDAAAPDAGSLYGGNVLRYGLGAAYDLGRSDCRKLQAVGEMVGWTCLYGFRNTGANGALGDVVNASGDTIVNVKAGLRYTQGCHTFYVGYGFPVTADPSQLYNSIVRVDYTYWGW